jgi:hypothetical protein
VAEPDERGRVVAEHVLRWKVAAGSASTAGVAMTLSLLGTSLVGGLAAGAVALAVVFGVVRARQPYRVIVHEHGLLWCSPRDERWVAWTDIVAVDRTLTAGVLTVDVRDGPPLELPVALERFATLRAVIVERRPPALPLPAARLLPKP